MNIYGGVYIEDEQGNRLPETTSVNNNSNIITPNTNNNVNYKPRAESGLGKAHELGTLVGDGIVYSTKLMSKFFTGLSTRKEEIVDTYNESVDKFKKDFEMSVKKHREITNSIDNNTDTELMEKGDVDAFGIHSTFTEIIDTINDIKDPQERLMLVWFITSFTMKELSVLYKSVKMN
tara:strand:+ start:1943 stop:2473 length:531 start_codon:yes stop_codon:yes gene_type:complete